MAVTQVVTPTQGTDGRIKNATGDVIIGGITSWRRQSSAAMLPYPHFESGADVATETVQPGKLKGLGDSKVRVEGWYNVHTVAQTEIGNTGITNGAYLSMDFIVSKALATGYEGVPGWISEFEVGQQINNQVCAFSATLDVDGVFPPYSAVA